MVIFSPLFFLHFFCINFNVSKLIYLIVINFLKTKITTVPQWLYVFMLQQFYYIVRLEYYNAIVWLSTSVKMRKFLYWFSYFTQFQKWKMNIIGIQDITLLLNMGKTTTIRTYCYHFLILSYNRITYNINGNFQDP